MRHPLWALEVVSADGSSSSQKRGEPPVAKGRRREAYNFEEGEKSTKKKHKKSKKSGSSSSRISSSGESMGDVPSKPGNTSHQSRNGKMKGRMGICPNSRICPMPMPHDLRRIYKWAQTYAGGNDQNGIRWMDQ